MTTFVKAVLVSTALLTCVSAQEHRNSTEQQQHGSNRPETEMGRTSQNGNNRAYYDSKHRDWHQWNDRENQSYSRYAEEHHRDNRDFSRSKEREQQQYWNWRHKHSDEH